METDIAKLPVECWLRDLDGDGRATSRDLLLERDCLAESETPWLRLQLRGWLQWWKDQGADDGGKTDKRIG